MYIKYHVWDIFKNTSKNNHLDEKIEFISHTTESVSELKAFNRLNIIRDLRNYLKKIELDNGDILESKLIITDILIDNLNSIRDNKNKEILSNGNKRLCVQYINSLMELNFAYCYKLSKNGVFYKRQNSKFVVSNSPRAIKQQPILNYAVNNTSKFKKNSKKISCYGVSLVNKYGATHAGRLEAKYNAEAKHNANKKFETYHRMKEYVIEPSNGVLQLIVQNNQAVLPILNEKKFVITHKNRRLKLDHLKNYEHNSYYQFERVYNVNSNFLDSFVMTNVKRRKLMMKAIPRDVFRIKNILVSPIDGLYRTPFTIFYEMKLRTHNTEKRFADRHGGFNKTWIGEDIQFAKKDKTATTPQK
jgi:hypothetical protein